MTTTVINATEYRELPLAQLNGRVEDWRGIRRLSLSVAPRFLWECLTSSFVNPFPAPATSNATCGFPALRSPVCFMSRFM
jgi:hypothetical protein